MDKTSISVPLLVPLRWYWSFIYVVLEFNISGTGNETKCLFLTDKKKVYLYDSNEGDTIEFVESDVIMASFNNNRLQTIKI